MTPPTWPEPGHSANGFCKRFYAIFQLERSDGVPSGRATLANTGRVTSAPAASSVDRLSPEACISSFLSPLRLSSLWERLRTSFWFLPSAMALAAISLSFLLVQVDSWLGVEAGEIVNERA
jgi:hypothetical protein